MHLYLESSLKLAMTDDLIISCVSKLQLHNSLDVTFSNQLA